MIKVAIGDRERPVVAVDARRWIRRIGNFHIHTFLERTTRPRRCRVLGVFDRDTVAHLGIPTETQAVLRIAEEAVVNI